MGLLQGLDLLQEGDQTVVLVLAQREGRHDRVLLEGRLGNEGVACPGDQPADAPADPPAVLGADELVVVPAGAGPCGTTVGGLTYEQPVAVRERVGFVTRYKLASQTYDAAPGAMTCPTYQTIYPFDDEASFDAWMHGDDRAAAGEDKAKTWGGRPYDVIWAARYDLMNTRNAPTNQPEG